MFYTVVDISLYLKLTTNSNLSVFVGPAGVYKERDFGINISQIYGHLDIWRIFTSLFLLRLNHSIMGLFSSHFSEPRRIFVETPGQV